jgi:hypothetical protein
MKTPDSHILQLPARVGVFEPDELAAIASVFDQACKQSGISKESKLAREGLARILFDATETQPSVEKLEAIGIRAMEHWGAIHERYN